MRVLGKLMQRITGMALRPAWLLVVAPVALSLLWAADALARAGGGGYYVGGGGGGGGGGGDGGGVAALIYLVIAYPEILFGPDHPSRILLPVIRLDDIQVRGTPGDNPSAELPSN